MLAPSAVRATTARPSQLLPVVADEAPRHEPAVVAGPAAAVLPPLGPLHQGRAGRHGRLERRPGLAAGSPAGSSAGSDAGRGERAQRARIAGGRRVGSDDGADGVEEGEAGGNDGRRLGREGREHQGRLAGTGGPAGQGGHAIAAHQVGDRSEVGPALDQGSAQHPDEVRGALDPLHPGRESAGETGPDESVRAGAGAGGPAPDVGEGVRVRVEVLDHVVAPGGVRHVEHPGPGGEVHAAHRVGGVHVGQDHRLHGRVGERADAHQLVLGEALNGALHRDRPEAVHVGGQPEAEGASRARAATEALLGSLELRAVEVAACRRAASEHALGNAGGGACGAWRERGGQSGGGAGEEGQTARHARQGSPGSARVPAPRSLLAGL